MNYTILIVDDDMAINDMLVKYLRKNGYITYSAYSGTEALLFLEKQKVNLIILDLMLPGLSGEQVLAEIKKTKNVPVIGLSAKEDSKSKIFLLKNGADDYVTKPFDIEELLARIETILRRIYENQYTSNSLLCCGDLNLDTIGMEATLKNQKLPLTKNEFAILKMLMEHPQQVFTKDMIYEQLWNEALEGTENAINVHISNLRKKIAAIDNSKSYIKTVWGIGFLGKETIDLYNTSETRSNQKSFGLNYQKTGKQLMTEDEIAVMDGGKCILQIRGARPFFSDKYDITKHKNYRLLADENEKNRYKVEKELNPQYTPKPEEEVEVIHVELSE